MQIKEISLNSAINWGLSHPHRWCIGQPEFSLLRYLKPNELIRVSHELLRIGPELDITFIVGEIEGIDLLIYSFLLVKFIRVDFETYSIFQELKVTVVGLSKLKTQTQDPIQVFILNMHSFISYILQYHFDL